MGELGGVNLRFIGMMSLLWKNLKSEKRLEIIIHFDLNWCAERFWDIPSNCPSTWPYRTFIWRVHGTAVHRRGSCRPFTIGWYHSLVIEQDTFPNDELEVTAWTDNGCSFTIRTNICSSILKV
ncbi:hypothetical protein QQ045_015043 [Rhodiola kirilowii]